MRRPLPGKDARVESQATDYEDPLVGVEMFAGLDAETRQRVAAAAVPRVFRKGQLLFMEER